MPGPTANHTVLVGAVVFVANAGLLVLQLLAGKLLTPFVGSSLETWTAVIVVFLAGIAIGNAIGGRLADANPSPRKLSVLLLFGALAAAWTALAPVLFHQTDGHRLLPLSVRIPVLTAVLCFPVGFVLSLLTPLAIRVGLSFVSNTGREAGRVFALGTLGCLTGNYFTGFYLLSWLPIDVIAFGVAGVLLLLAGVTWIAFSGTHSTVATHRNEAADPRSGLLSIRRAYTVVFLSSFTAMALELAAVRLLAQVFGVSLFTWTGAIGVMLAGTAAGNWLGGRAADRSPNAAGLARTLIAASATVGLVVVLFILAVRTEFFPSHDIQLRIVCWSFLLFFLPMLFLGTVSPRVIRLAISDVGHAGRVAGRVYAWSTAGAIAGTFATGLVLIAALGTYRLVLAATLLPAAAAFLVTPVWKQMSLLYPICVVCGAAVAGLFTFTPEVTGVTKETNYYAIHVKPVRDDHGENVPNRYTLQLDSLVHSQVDTSDPTFLHYKHEHVQLEVLQVLRARVANPRVLVIGGGGYTFPRCAKTVVASCSIDVVEIDPGVTEVSYSRLGLERSLGIVSHHMDGRQFLTERAASGSYDLIALDAVNDLSVPGHLLTLEFDREIKRCLAPGGVYLITVIDTPAHGTLWRAVRRTLRDVFPQVEIVSGEDWWDPERQSVLVFYASSEPFDFEKLKRLGPRIHTKRPPIDASEAELTPVLTDRFAPVEQMMADVYRRRKFDR